MAEPNPEPLVVRKRIARWLLLTGVIVASLLAKLVPVAESRANARLVALRSGCTDSLEPKPSPTSTPVAKIEEKSPSDFEGFKEALPGKTMPSSTPTPSAMADEDFTITDYDPSLAAVWRGKYVNPKCDPVGSEFDRFSEAGKSIESAYEEKQRWERLGRLRPLLVAFIFAVPWLWYFLLDRVRELSDAFRGGQ